MISRRKLLAGAASAALVSDRPAHAAWSPIQAHAVASSTPTGWSTLPIGGGGFARSLKVNPTSGDLFLQTDTAGGWIWNTTKALWQQVLQGLPTATFNDGGSWLPGTGVYALDSAPSNSSIVYLAFLSEVLVSTNKCASWTSTAFSAGTGIFAANTAYDTVSPKLAIDPANPNIVFIGTYQNGVWFTTNGGTSWTQISSSQIPLSTTEPSEGGYPGYTILFDPSSAVSGGATQGIYISSYGNGLYHSTNGGSTFSLVSGSSTAITFAKITPTGIYYCLTDTTFDGIDQQAQNLRKLQSGTWSVILNSTSFGADISAFCVNPNNLSQIIAFTVSGYCQASINGGSTWSGYANAAPGGVNYTGSITWQWAQTNFYLVVGNCEFDPRTPGQVLVSHGTGASTVTFPSSGSWPSGVMNWTTNSQGEESLVGNKIVCLPNNHGIIVRCDDFPIFKLDGVHYPSTYYPPGVAAFNNGFGVMVSDVDYASDLSGVVLAHLGVTSIYSTDWGATWSALPNIPATGQGNVAVSTSTNWIYGEYGTGLWYTLNAGATWTAVTISGAVWAGYGGFSLVADRVTAGTFYIYIAQTNTGTPVLYKSTNGGASWTAVYTAGNTGGIFGSGNGFENPGILRAVPGQAGHLFAAFGPYVVGQSWAGNTYTLAFSNGGATWTAVGGIGVPFGVAHGPAAAGQSYPSIYVVGYDPTGLTFGLYRCVNFNPSSPGSATWTLLGGSNASFAPVGNIDEIAWLDADPTNYGKVYWSSNGEGYCQGYFP